MVLLQIFPNDRKYFYANIIINIKQKKQRKQKATSLEPVCVLICQADGQMLWNPIKKNSFKSNLPK